jgi:hypothetical protein
MESAQLESCKKIKQKFGYRRVGSNSLNDYSIVLVDSFSLFHPVDPRFHLIDYLFDYLFDYRL